MSSSEIDTAATTACIGLHTREYYEPKRVNIFVDALTKCCEWAKWKYYAAATLFKQTERLKRRQCLVRHKRMATNYEGLVC